MIVKDKMKRYKLVKDLPTFNAGDVFYLTGMGNLLRESDNVPAYSWSTIDEFPNILTDWFEEIKEPTRWKPEKHDKYYHVAYDGSATEDSWDNWDVDRGNLEIGNCFQTREEAERVVEYLKALAVVRGDATTKFTKGKANWHVFCDIENNSFHPDCNYIYAKHGIFDLPYFASEDDARRSIELHKKEWLVIFGVENLTEEEK